MKVNNLSSNLLEQNSYLLSLLLGAIMIAVFASAKTGIGLRRLYRGIHALPAGDDGIEGSRRKQYNQAYAL